MELLNKVKTDLEKNKGYDFASEFWTDEMLCVLHHAVYATKKAMDEVSGKENVSGSLPMYDVEELNEIVKELNSGKLSLFDFVGKVWNKAYILGCIDGSKGNDH